MVVFFTETYPVQWGHYDDPAVTLLHHYPIPAVPLKGRNQSNPPDGHMTSSHISRPQSPSILMLPVITIATLALRPFSRPFHVAFFKNLLFCRISIAVNCQCIIVWSFCVLNHVDQKVFYKIHLCKHEHFSADLMLNNCW